MWECKGCIQTPCIAFRSADEDVCRCAYAYDYMGNISGDNLEIGYNFLNLPKETVKTTTERDRFGQMKQRKTYNDNRYLSDGTKVSSYDAAGNGYMYLGTARFSLDNNVPTLESVPFSGGIIIRTTNGYEPQCYLTYHLGSVSRVLDVDLNVVERNDYYPFGKRIDDPECVISDNLYRYNGKESLEIFGIPYSDYGARLYDSNIGRWLQTDPLASDYPNIGPYTFCANNPMNVIDPNGMALSTHTDINGYVISVFDDGDLGVYRHNLNNEDAKKEVKEFYSKKNTSANGEYMGEFLHSWSFTKHNSYKTGKPRPNESIRIDFGSKKLTDAVQDIIDAESNIISYMNNARSGGIWDIKSHSGNIGSLLYGRYASPRDAGNFAAGIFAGMQGTLSPIIHFGYGSYNCTGNNLVKTGIVTLGVGSLIANYTTRPIGLAIANSIRLYGEDPLTQLAINIGEQFYNNGYKF